MAGELTRLSSHNKFDTMGPALTKEQMPEGVRPVPLDTILRVKRDGRKKARLIVKGFHLVNGLDYNNTFAGVPDVTILKLFTPFHLSTSVSLAGAP